MCSAMSGGLSISAQGRLRPAAPKGHAEDELELLLGELAELNDGELLELLETLGLDWLEELLLDELDELLLETDGLL